jgi:hypothetical protein
VCVSVSIDEEEEEKEGFGEVNMARLETLRRWSRRRKNGKAQPTGVSGLHTTSPRQTFGLSSQALPCIVYSYLEWRDKMIVITQRNLFSL